MVTKKSRNEMRKKRQLRIRKNIHGTADVPRLNVFRSNTHIYAQIINDDLGVTLVSASSLDSELNLKNTSNVEAAAAVGNLIAQRALEHKIDKVVFDRGGFLYHGRVQALAEAAREAGLQF